MSTVSQLGKLGLFDARVPRYTSYPTAPHFSPATTPAQVRGWMSSVSPQERISLYIHVPFCRRLCWFCACRTQGTATLSPVETYVQTLKREIAMVRDALPAGVALEHLHWGGGTPTLLPADSISDLAATVFEALPLAEGAQFSVEIDPNEIDAPRLQALEAAGLNRASIGVQDFDEEIQATIGRKQGYEITARAIDGLRKAGIGSLNMDILYGLPHQSREKIAASVRKVIALGPDRVALYGYAHVPWMAKRQSMIPTDVLPTPQERLALFETARELFLDAGYEEIGIDHFARPEDGLARARQNGTLRRNFQGYTEDTSTTLIGIGASAISRYRQGYAQNAAATSAYQAAIRDESLATARGHRFSPDDIIRGRLIEALLCDFELRHASLAAELGVAASRLREMTAALPAAFPGMLEDRPERLRILPHARPLARMIARELDSYDMSQSRHSHAV